MLSHPSRRRVSLDCGTELITKQSFKNETDINNILTQFKRTGIITHTSQHQPMYADLPDNLDFQQSLAIVEQAENAFQTLPSVTRAYYNNDPATFLAALSDPSQKQQLIEFGIFNDPNAPPPQPAGNPPPAPGQVIQQPSLLPQMMTPPNQAYQAAPPPPPPAPTK